MTNVTNEGVSLWLYGICNEAVTVWLSGGWGMALLAINGILISWLGLTIKARLSKGESRRLTPETCTRWIEDPSLRGGSLGALVGSALAARGQADMESLFDEYRHVAFGPFDRDLRIMQVCVTASPLLGLLGTVTGMLTTFSALAVGTGGDQTMKMVASGISEALITTETGLVIAIPGLLFLHHLRRQNDLYQGFLARLQTACAQALQRRLTAAILPGTSQPSESLSTPALGDVVSDVVSGDPQTTKPPLAARPIAPHPPPRAAMLLGCCHGRAGKETAQ